MLSLYYTGRDVEHERAYLILRCVASILQNVGSGVPMNNASCEDREICWNIFLSSGTSCFCFCREVVASPAHAVVRKAQQSSNGSCCLMSNLTKTIGSRSGQTVPSKSSLHSRGAGLHSRGIQDTSLKKRVSQDTEADRVTRCALKQMCMQRRQQLGEGTQWHRLHKLAIAAYR